MYREPADNTEETFEHKTNFLFVKPDECGWVLTWWEADEADEGEDLSRDPDFDPDDDDDDDAWENQVACDAVAKLDTTREEPDDHDDVAVDVFYWVTKEDADQACAVAMAAIMAYRENPKWAAKALAAGWSPPTKE